MEPESNLSPSDASVLVSDHSTQVRENARRYIGYGWTPIRLKPREKIPAGKHETNKLSLNNIDEFIGSKKYNIGVMLGAESDNLVDLDFDWPESREVGPALFSVLPSFGRVSARGGHRLAKCANAKSVKFSLPSSVVDSRLPDQHTLTVLEIRASGQTMFPPSVHPSGEAVEWAQEWEPPTLTWDELRRLAGLVAFLAVCVRLWPQEGTRDETSMALAGALLSANMTPEGANKAASFVAKLAGDEEFRRRTKAEQTAEKRAKGEPTTGLPKLVELLALPDACLKTFREWLCIKPSTQEGDLGEEAVSRDAENQVVLDRSAPLDCARELINSHFRSGEDRTLVFHKDDYFIFDRGRYRPIEITAIHKSIYEFTDAAVVIINKQSNPFKPSNRHIAAIEHALRSLVLVEQHLLEPPCWIAGTGAPPRELLVCRNGLLHLPTGQMTAHTPRLFNLNGLDIDYEPSAPPPERWLTFLGEVFPGDDEAIATLQEIIGYFLTPETRHHKAFMLVAPPRSGKGTIARVIEDLVGVNNYSGIKLRSLGEQFGMQSLIGKLLAIVTDARVGSKVDKGALVETILTVSGEDRITIDRKNKDAWEGTLPVRFFIHTNEIPQLEDMSGALASRFVMLTTQESFLGREDHALGDKLKAELPGILLWAIEGWRRLRERGRFVQPTSAQEMLRLMSNMSSPVTAFVEERCVIGPDFTCSKDDLYQEFRTWQAEQGRTHPPTKDIFANKLYSAFRYITEGKGPRNADRKPEFRGIKLREEGEVTDAYEGFPSAQQDIPF